MHFILALHSLVRWAILLFGLWTLLNALTGVLTKRPFSAGDNRSNLLFMIFCDVQLLIGLILYFFGPIGLSLFKADPDVMKHTANRFFAVEHETMMILAWILVHVGRSSVKKATTDAAKHKRMLIFFGLAIIIILAGIPWPFRQEVARPWFQPF